MQLSGEQMLAGSTSLKGDRGFVAVNPATGQVLEPEYREATPEEVDRAVKMAAECFDDLRGKTVDQRADFLERIAANIDALGDALTRRAHEETGLPLARLNAERARTANGARLFAKVVREGSWVDARIDRSDPGRTPLPKPDLRRMLVPVGPAAVFGASNFPLAISVAGNDTVAALGAGCPVVVKAHPAHPGTSELVARAIAQAVKQTGMPDGAFSLIHGASPEIALCLVGHPELEVVAFTGSLRAGRALFDAAAARKRPIPVYAEMGSTNPVFVLPGALAERGSAIARGYVDSVNMGVGQFCTSPGLVLGLGGNPMDQFLEEASQAAKAIEPATMLHAGIRDSYQAGVSRIEQTPGLRLAARSSQQPSAAAAQAACVLFTTDAEVFHQHPHLTQEVFGPCSIIVRCQTLAELEAFAESLEGQLTATVHASPKDLVDFAGFIRRLERKVGRIIMNGFPTGLEVCAALHHGGPYPATTHSHFTSIGTAGILRFARPVCYQNFPNEALPEPLRNENPRGIWRLVDDQLTRDPL